MTCGFGVISLVVGNPLWDTLHIGQFDELCLKMVKINSVGGGDGQDPRDNGDYQAKMAELLRREQQAIKRQVIFIFETF